MNIQNFLTGTLTFLNDKIIPLLLAIAFLAFVWNAVQFFIFQGDSEEGQTKAKSLTLWSILAFVIILSLWGIVNMIVAELGFGRTMGITPDYIDSKSGYSSPDDWGTGSNLSTGSDADCVRTDTCFDP